MALYPYSLSINNSGYEFLIFKDVNFIREAYPDSSSTGVPKYYSIFDDETFMVAPTPNGNFTAELHYSYLPQSIVDASSGTSWLGDNATNALLYGSLVQAYIFMKGEPDIIQQYQQQFEISVGQLKKEGEGFNRTDAYRTGQASISTK